jgi:hypothetical protein
MVLHCHVVRLFGHLDFLPIERYLICEYHMIFNHNHMRYFQIKVGAACDGLSRVVADPTLQRQKKSKSQGGPLQSVQ